MRTVVQAAAAAAVFCFQFAGVFAQNYPTKPIRLIAPFAPGGGIDILARSIATPAAESFGQPIVIDNRPGAGGMTGAEMVAKAPPDGYTLIMVASTYATTSAYGRPSYDPIEGIEPIVLIGTTGLVLTVHPSIPAKSVKELVGYAKANPARLNYSSVGAGSIPHLALELFKLETGIQCVHVPYKGAGPALVALVGGEVQLTALSLVPVLPHVRAGRLRALGITQPQRSSLLPELPTIGESVPGFEVIHWYGMWGPKGMPGPIVSRWNHEVAKLVRSDAMSARLRSEGLDPAGGPPQQFGDIIRRDVLKWRRVIQDAKIAREG
jgi:tripartite-type tricarboxylate transporter receptor subunit TctC